MKETTNHRFSLESWKAPIFLDPDRLRDALYECHLEGRIIKSFRLEDEGEFASDFMAGYLQGEDRKSMQEVPAFLNLTGPCVIEFEDGEQLELFMQSQSVVRLSMNELGKGRTSASFFDPNRLFRQCIGCAVEFVDVQVTDDFPDLAFRYREQLKQQQEYIDSVLICLDSGDALTMYSWGDTGEIDLLDSGGEIVMKQLDDIL